MNNFSLYMGIKGTIKQLNNQYNDSSKEIIESAISDVLYSIYNNKEVYMDIISFMRNEGIYERYIRAILELQINSPKTEIAQNSEISENIPKEKDTKGEHIVKTKDTDTNKDITKKFIDNLFKNED